ncbi:MAG: carboxypeptidase-like regulatory domain-containing protein [Salibacteraceae bacterium]
MPKHVQPISLRNTFSCSQNWDEMSPDTQGRFCSKCSKSVLDITPLTDFQIKILATKHPQGFCAKANTHQLNRPIGPIERTKPGFPLVPLLAGIITLSSPSLLFAQTQVQPIEDVIILNGEAHCPTLKGNPTNRIIDSVSGYVYDQETSEPIPFVQIYVKGTKLGCLSDINGNFKLMIPDSMQAASYEMICSFIGYEKKAIIVHSKQVELPMVIMSTQIVGLMMVEPHAIKPSKRRRKRNK